MNIREAKTEDVKAFVDIYGYYVRKYPYSFEYTPPSVEDFEKRIEVIIGGLLFFVCENEGEIIGFTYANKYKERKAYQWICESSIYVKKVTPKQELSRFCILFYCLHKKTRLYNSIYCFGVS